MFCLLTTIWNLLFTYHFLFSKCALKKKALKEINKLTTEFEKGGRLTQMATSIIRHIYIRDNCGIDIAIIVVTNIPLRIVNIEIDP